MRQKDIYDQFQIEKKTFDLLVCIKYFSALKVVKNKKSGISSLYLDGIMHKWANPH